MIGLADSFKERLVNCLREVYAKSAANLYVAGSRSKNSEKKPREDSDLDIFVFKSNPGRTFFCEENIIMSEMFTQLMNFPIQIFETSWHFEKHITFDMEPVDENILPTS